jgi:hypothetical protein
MLAMLQRQQGVTIAAVMKATVWQQHSVRSFFAGVVREKLGLTQTSEKSDVDRAYRMVAARSEKRHFISVRLPAERRSMPIKPAPVCRSFE